MNKSELKRRLYAHGWSTEEINDIIEVHRELLEEYVSWLPQKDEWDLSKWPGLDKRLLKLLNRLKNEEIEIEDV